MNTAVRVLLVIAGAAAFSACATLQVGPEGRRISDIVPDGADMYAYVDADAYRDLLVSAAAAYAGDSAEDEAARASQRLLRDTDQVYLGQYRRAESRSSDFVVAMSGTYSRATYQFALSANKAWECRSDPVPWFAYRATGDTPLEVAVPNRTTFLASSGGMTDLLSRVGRLSESELTRVLAESADNIQAVLYVADVSRLFTHVLDPVLADRVTAGSARLELSRPADAPHVSRLRVVVETVSERRARLYSSMMRLALRTGRGAGLLQGFNAGEADVRSDGASVVLEGLRIEDRRLIEYIVPENG